MIKEERGVHLEKLSHTKKELSSQFARIKQTIAKVLDSDTSLGERIKILFREQGITLVSVVTALGFIIATIYEALTGVVTRYTPKPSGKGGVKEWFQKQLKAFARLLGKLAEKLGTALPGILGSIVSWVFNLLQKTISFFAEHVWLFLVFVGGLIFSYITIDRKSK